MIRSLNFPHSEMKFHPVISHSYTSGRPKKKRMDLPVFFDRTSNPLIVSLSYTFVQGFPNEVISVMSVTPLLPFHVKVFEQWIGIESFMPGIWRLIWNNQELFDFIFQKNGRFYLPLTTYGEKIIPLESLLIRFAHGNTGKNWKSGKRYRKKSKPDKELIPGIINYRNF